LLTKELLGHWPSIEHNASGQPYIADSTLSISISHSHDLVGVLLGPHKHLGIDIENTNRNVERVLNRFLSEMEYQQIKDASDARKVLYWCTKEAVFKAMGTSNIEFSKRIIIREVIEVPPFNSIKALFYDNTSPKEILLHFFEISGNWVVWVS